jgi:hypothetical protein
MALTPTAQTVIKGGVAAGFAGLYGWGVTEGLTASAEKTKENVYRSVPTLAAMYAGGGGFNQLPRTVADVVLNMDRRMGTPMDNARANLGGGGKRYYERLTPEQFGKLTPQEKETYNIYGTTTPMEAFAAKQRYERGIEASVRTQGSPKIDIVTKAFLESRSEPAVAPWEREQIPQSFDLTTLKTKSQAVAVSQPEPLTQAKNIISSIPEPKPSIHEPALESWERAEILKKLYPEEHASSTGFGEVIVEPSRGFTFPKTSTGRGIGVELQGPKMLRQQEVSVAKKPTTYKEPVDITKLNKLLRRKGMNIPTAEELKAPTTIDLISKGYDWNVARKMGTVGTHTQPTSEISLQLQPRISPASTPRPYEEVQAYTSVPSALELEAPSERALSQQKQREVTAYPKVGITTKTATKTSEETRVTSLQRPVETTKIKPSQKTETRTTTIPRQGTWVDPISRIETTVTPRTTRITKTTPVITPTVRDEPIITPKPPIIPIILKRNLPSFSGGPGAESRRLRSKKFTKTLAVGEGVGWINIFNQPKPQPKPQLRKRKR